MSAVIRLAAAVVRGVCDEDGPKAEVMRELAIDARREHDAAIAERDRLRAQVTDLLPEADAAQHFATRALRAEDRLTRMRRELEALREWADSVAEEQWPDTTAESLVERLDAILRG